MMWARVGVPCRTFAGERRVKREQDGDAQNNIVIEFRIGCSSLRRDKGGDMGCDAGKSPGSTVRWT